jgi:large subunit ribosomal protein L9
MKVVFFEDVEGTAQVGDTKEVKNGFARNFLLPRGIAGPTTPTNLQHANSLAQKEARRQEKLDAEARGDADKLDGYKISIEARVGETGRLFGSVTNRDIAQHIKDATGIEVESHIILLAEPIRELGERTVNVKFTRNVSSELIVDVVPDEESIPVVEKLLAEQKEKEEAEAKIAAEKAYQAAQQRADSGSLVEATMARQAEQEGSEDSDDSDDSDDSADDSNDSD